MPLVGIGKLGGETETSLQLRVEVEKRADTNLTDLIAGYKELIVCTN